MDLDGCALKLFGQLLERLPLLVANMGIGGSRCRVLESIDNLSDGNCRIFCQGSERHFGIMWKELYRNIVDNCPCLWQVYVVALVVVLSSIHIPAISSLGFPTFADSGISVYNDLRSWRVNRSGIVVKFSMELCLGQEGRINLRWSKKIQGEYRLCTESTPQVQRKIVMCGY